MTKKTASPSTTIF